MALACLRVLREPAEIKIVAVSKGRQVEEIMDAADFGLLDIGENRVQEASLKYSDKRLVIKGLPIKWHMIGHLQTNKVRDAVMIFDLIHSVDSLPLAYEVNKQAARIGKIQNILIEVKTSPEKSKSGFSPDEVSEGIDKISGLKNISVKGLMTIPALTGSNPQDARPYFRVLREIRDKINNDLLLSMGMTDDFEIAIEEGADIIRIGRAIFDNYKG